MKTEKLLKKLLARRFTFDGSRADLEPLRSIYERTCANSKRGDPSFHAYAAAVNVASEFASQALDRASIRTLGEAVSRHARRCQSASAPGGKVTPARTSGG